MVKGEGTVVPRRWPSTRPLAWAIQAKVNEVADLIQVVELDAEYAAGLIESMSEFRGLVLCGFEATGRPASLLACIDLVVETLSSL